MTSFWEMWWQTYTHLGNSSGPFPPEVRGQKSYDNFFFRFNGILYHGISFSATRNQFFILNKKLTESLNLWKVLLSYNGYFDKSEEFSVFFNTLMIKLLPIFNNFHFTEIIVNTCYLKLIKISRRKMKIFIFREWIALLE